MSWVAVGVAAAGVIAGKMKNDAAKAQEDSDRKLAAETQRYSPWTGMSANKIQRAGSEFGDMFSGGVQGAMVGQSLSNGMAGMSEAPGAAEAAGGAAGPNYLGSPNYAGKLGQEYQMQPPRFK